ncbi:MAG: TlpA disulfide reductase family protein [Gammaproteobacteria bacterium]
MNKSRCQITIPYIMLKPYYSLTLIVLLTFACSLLFAATEKTINLENNNEFSYLHFNVTNSTINKNTIALWVVQGYPNESRFHEFSQRLTENGIEVWMVNILDNLFIPKGVNSTRQLTGQYVAELITRIHQQTNKNVILVAQSYSAIPILRGARLWQKSKPKKRYLTGAVLFSPNLITAIPPLGEKPEYVDIVTQTTIPILLFQSQKNSNRGQLQELLALFQKSNASVYTSVLKNSIAIFYHEDNSPETIRYLQELPDKITASLKLLESSPLPLNNTITIKQTKNRSIPLDSGLKKYQANNPPLKINLKDIDGNDFIRSDYKNRITIINFWATWCKPCLEEIPSLNNLQAKMKGKSFEIISINYAETPETIKKFMKEVKIDFPILIDESGAQAVLWKVYAFPSTFVIAPDGKFHYGVNAGILWDTPEVIKTLKTLYTLKK